MEQEISPQFKENRYDVFFESGDFIGDGYIIENPSSYTLYGRKPITPFNPIFLCILIGFSIPYFFVYFFYFNILKIGLPPVWISSGLAIFFYRPIGFFSLGLFINPVFFSVTIQKSQVKIKNLLFNFNFFNNFSSDPHLQIDINENNRTIRTYILSSTLENVKKLAGDEFSDKKSQPNFTQLQNSYPILYNGPFVGSGHINILDDELILSGKFLKFPFRIYSESETAISSILFLCFLAISFPIFFLLPYLTAKYSIMVIIGWFFLTFVAAKIIVMANIEKWKDNKITILNLKKQEIFKITYYSFSNLIYIFAPFRKKKRFKYILDLRDIKNPDSLNALISSLKKFFPAMKIPGMKTES